MHSDGHTAVPRVGAHAKLGEGSTQRVSVCEGVNLAPNFLSVGSQLTGPDCCNEPSKE